MNLTESGKARVPLGSGVMALFSGSCANSKNAEAFGHLMIITAVCLVCLFFNL